MNYDKTSASLSNSEGDVTLSMKPVIEEQEDSHHIIVNVVWKKCPDHASFSGSVKFENSIIKTMTMNMETHTVAKMNDNDGNFVITEQIISIMEQKVVSLHSDNTSLRQILARVKSRT